MKLIPLSAEEIHASWGWLRNGLLHVIAKNPKAHFLPEDVYLRLRNGTAWAYALGEDEFGFIVLLQEFDPDGLALIVWALWCEPGGAVEHKDAIYAALEDLARQVKAKRIRMYSGRSGWERESFFDRVGAIFEHEVT